MADKGAKQQTFTIDEELVAVWIAKKSASVWIAYGTPRRGRVEATGDSEAEAISTWLRKANHEASA